MAAVELLEERGPSLGRPAVDRVTGSRHHHMKELRSFGGYLRALFCFDPERNAIVLVGGDKRDDWSRLVQAQHPTRRRPIRRAHPTAGTGLMARHLDEIRKRRPLDDEARARVDATKRAMSLQVALAELREGRGMSQAGVAEELGTSRPNVSRIESEVDVRLSTLERFVEALGGRLEIHAVFDDEAVKLS